MGFAVGEPRKSPLIGGDGDPETKFKGYLK